MRKLMWFSIGAAAACALTAYVVYGHWGLLFLLSLFAIPIYFWVPKIQKQVKFCAFGFLGALIWMLVFDGIYLSPIRSMDGKKIEAAIEITDYSVPSGDRSRSPGKVYLNGFPYQVNVYSQQALMPGDKVEGLFWVRYTGPGGEKTPTYHQGKGIYLLCYPQREAVYTSSDTVPWNCFPAMLRQHIAQLLDTLYGEEYSGFARALLLGDDSLLTYEQDSSLKTSGIRHVIAVSGLHVSVLFGIVYLLCGRKRGLTALVGIPILVVFAAVAGFTPSIVRACLMQILMILSMLVDKEYDPPTALGFSVLVILGINPLAITSVSFQLSVGCLAGIFLCSEPIRGYISRTIKRKRLPKKSKRKRFLSWVGTSLSITLGAMVFTAPLCGYYFGAISIIGILTNLLTLWAVTLIFCGIILSCVLGTIWLPAGTFIAWLITFLMDYCLGITSFFSRISFASVYTSSPYIAACLIFCYILTSAFLFCKKKHPWFMCGCMAAGLFAALLFSWLEPRQDVCRATVLDVGQGQCVLLQNKEKAFLVDCGGESAERAADVTLQTLISQGITRLDGVIITHFDSDHVNAVEGVLSRVSADALYFPDIYDDNGRREELETLYGNRITWVTEKYILPLPDGKMTIFPSLEGAGDNDQGLCILFQPADYDILITGDRSFSGEEELMVQTDLPRLELLVVGHHGSNTSTGMSFLRETCPVTAVISAGERNKYGHPGKDTLNRLSLFGCKVFRTDQDGTITFRGE